MSTAQKQIHGNMKRNILLLLMLANVMLCVAAMLVPFVRLSMPAHGATLDHYIRWQIATEFAGRHVNPTGDVLSCWEFHGMGFPCTMGYIIVANLAMSIFCFATIALSSAINLRSGRSICIIAFLAIFFYMILFIILKGQDLVDIMALSTGAWILLLSCIIGVVVSFIIPQNCAVDRLGSAVGT